MLTPSQRKKKVKIEVQFCSWFMVFNATFNNISVISWDDLKLVEI